MSPLENDVIDNTQIDCEFKKVAPIRPSVFFLVGDFSEEEVAEVQKKTIDRVTSTALHRLFSIKRIAEIDDQKMDEFINQLKPFLTNEFWSGLLSDELIEREDLPGIGKLPSINIFLVFNNIRGKNPGIIEKFNAIAKRIEAYLTNKAVYNFSLILIGKQKISIDKVKEYFPKFKISEENTRGIRVDDELVKECLVNIILALIYTDYLDDLFKEVLKRDCWIYIGASSIFVDFHSMSERINNAVIKTTLNTFFENALNENQKGILNNAIKKSVSETTKQLLKGSVEQLQDDLDIVLDQNEVISSEIRKGRDLSRVISGPKLFTIDYLSNKFKTKTDNIYARARMVADEENKNHIRLLENIWEGNFETEKPLTNSIYNSAAMPSGFTSLSFGVNKYIETLKKTIDVLQKNKKVDPAPLITEEFFNSKAEEMIFYQKTGRVAIERYFRRFASIPGTLVYLIPLIPLIYFLLTSVFHENDILALILSLGITLLIGAGEFVFWEVKRTNKENALQFKWGDDLTFQEKHNLSIAKMIIDLYLAIIAKIHKNFRYQMIKSLSEFEQFLATFQKNAEENLRKLEVFFLSYAESNIEPGTDIYKTEEFATMRLQQISYCEESTNSVLSKLEADHSNYKDYREYLFREYLINSLFKELDPNQVIQVISDESKKIISSTIDLGHVQTFVLSDEIEQLAKGKRWFWLEQKADPLGRLNEKEARGIQFCHYCVGDNAALEGAYGKYSNFWPKAAKVKQSALMNEMQCIRGIIVAGE